jgi:hypothetical protein
MFGREGNRSEVEKAPDLLYPSCCVLGINLKPEEETHAKDAMDTKEETYE